MSKKTILITGASTGFGRTTAELLSAAGHRVFASMRDIAGKNRGNATELRQQGLDVVELDVTDERSADGAIDHVLRESGRLDVLINNAGIASAGVTEAFTAEQTRALFDVNVVGLLRVTRAALPAMRRQKDGLVINIGSVLGRVTFPFFGIYGASKFAVEALSDSLHYELSQLGVEITLVQPSAYPTQMYSNALVPADGDRVSAYGKIGEIPSAMFQHFMTVFQSPDAPDPREVGKAIVRLVAQPKGSRPARLVVGASFGTDRVNEQTAPVQSEVLASLGLGHLAEVA